MTPTQYNVLRQLATGGTVSGRAISQALGVSRAAVSKHVQALQALGVPVSARAGRGYHLARPLALLNTDRLEAACRAAGLTLDFAPAMDSTNARLGQWPHGRVALCEYQTAGRGRRGRTWLSPPASGLCLSLGRRFEDGLPGLGPLGLVVGLAGAAAIEAWCGRRPDVKWPNDLVADGDKLGGCLVEIRGSTDGPCDVVVGIGLNVDMPDDFAPGQAWTDLRRWGGGTDRTALAEALIGRLAEDLDTFAGSGFGAFRQRWRAHDVLAGGAVTVTRPDGSVYTAEVEGLTDAGELRVRTDRGLHNVSAGDVSIRPSSGSGGVS